MSDNFEMTSGERLFIQRNRRGLTQAEAARDMGVSRRKYSLMEKDKTESDINIEIHDIQLHEKCLLARRRAGWTQERLSEELGISRFWIFSMESGRGSCERLRRFWKV